MRSALEDKVRDLAFKRLTESLVIFGEEFPNDKHMLSVFMHETILGAVSLTMADIKFHVEDSNGREELMDAFLEAVLRIQRTAKDRIDAYKPEGSSDEK